MPDRRQAIIWTNVGMLNCSVYASLGLNELTACGWVCWRVEAEQLPNGGQSGQVPLVVNIIPGPTEDGARSSLWHKSHHLPGVLKAPFISVAWYRGVAPLTVMRCIYREKSLPWDIPHLVEYIHQNISVWYAMYCIRRWKHYYIQLLLKRINHEYDDASKGCFAAI